MDDRPGGAPHRGENTLRPSVLRCRNGSRVRQGLTDIEQANRAYLEPNGMISIIPIEGAPTEHPPRGAGPVNR